MGTCALLKMFARPYLRAFCRLLASIRSDSGVNSGQASALVGRAQGTLKARSRRIAAWLAKVKQGIQRRMGVVISLAAANYCKSALRLRPCVQLWSFGAIYKLYVHFSGNARICYGLRACLRAFSLIRSNGNGTAELGQMPTFGARLCDRKAAKILHFH